MHVKNYMEAVKAIDDVVFGAKVPVLVMVGILEVTKHRLLIGPLLHEKAKETKEFLDAMQEEADKHDASRGVS